MALFHALIAPILLQGSIPVAQVSLVPNTFGIQPKTPFQIAVHLTLPKGWHTYFANPGVGGVPVQIKWQLPPGFTAGPILWPIPKHIISAGNPQYVYDKEVWLATDITPPDSLPTGKMKFSFSAKVSWQLCREISMNQWTNVSVVLESTRFPIRNLMFTQAQRSEPIPLPGIHLSAVTGERRVFLKLPLVQATVDQIQFFPGDSKYFSADQPTNRLKGSGMEFEIPLARTASKVPSHLVGLLVVSSPLGNKKRAHWIDLKVDHK